MRNMPTDQAKPRQPAGSPQHPVRFMRSAARSLPPSQPEYARAPAGLDYRPRCFPNAVRFTPYATKGGSPVSLIMGLATSAQRCIPPSTFLACQPELLRATVTCAERAPERQTT